MRCIISYCFFFLFYQQTQYTFCYKIVQAQTKATKQYANVQQPLPNESQTYANIQQQQQQQSQIYANVQQMQNQQQQDGNQTYENVNPSRTQDAVEERSSPRIDNEQTYANLV